MVQGFLYFIYLSYCEMTFPMLIKLSQSIRCDMNSSWTQKAINIQNSESLNCFPWCRECLSPKVNATKQFWIPVKVAADGHSGSVATDGSASDSLDCFVSAGFRQQFKLASLSRAHSRDWRVENPLHVTYFWYPKLLSLLENWKVLYASISAWGDNSFLCF